MVDCLVESFEEGSRMDVPDNGLGTERRTCKLGLAARNVYFVVCGPIRMDLGESVGLLNLVDIFGLNQMEKSPQQSSISDC